MLRMEIALFLVIAFVAYIYFSAEKERSELHRTFSVLLVVVLFHLVFDGITVYTVNRLETVLPIQSLHGVAYLLLHITCRCGHLAQRIIQSLIFTFCRMQSVLLFQFPEDVLTDIELQNIAREYLEKLGFGNQPYLVFKHEDIDRHHLSPG